MAVPLGYPYYDNSSISSAEKKNPHLGPLFKSVAAVTPKKSLREAKVQFLSTHLKRHRSRRRRRYSFNSVRSVSSISPEFGSSSRSRSVSPTSGSRQNVNSQTNLEEDPRINSIVPGKQPSPRNITVTRVKEIGGEVGDNTVGRNVPPPEDKNVPAEEEQNQEQNLEP